MGHTLLELGIQWETVITVFGIPSISTTGWEVGNLQQLLQDDARIRQLVLQMGIGHGPLGDPLALLRQGLHMRLLLLQFHFFLQQQNAGLCARGNEKERLAKAPAPLPHSAPANELDQPKQVTQQTLGSGCANMSLILSKSINISVNCDCLPAHVIFSSEVNMPVAVMHTV